MSPMLETLLFELGTRAMSLESITYKLRGPAGIESYVGY